MPLTTLLNHCRVRCHFVGLFLIACVLTGGRITNAQEQPPEPGFRDRTADLGLELANSKACWVDVDNDGWTDPARAASSGGITAAKASRSWSQGSAMSWLPTLTTTVLRICFRGHQSAPIAIRAATDLSQWRYLNSPSVSPVVPVGPTSMAMDL